jgi:hypothetical protein
MLLKTITTHDYTRFMKYIDKSKGCWEWTGYTNRVYGHGCFTYQGTQYSSYRFSYLLFNGPIEKGLVVRHMCNNRKCVNPDHLKIGTQQDNIQDIMGIRINVLKRG